MEGTLWKWTNYFSGWQPRWFVLDNGILSYYKSQEDVNNGCKGSLKLAVCDVIVHPTDPTRMDLIITGEQHFYVKAATPQERQQWLVMLGSSKACLNYCGKPVSQPEGISVEEIRAKKSELRLYCDLLMQQVHSVKTAVSEESPDKAKLDEATSLLSATCDTFIHTLEECMTIVNAKPGSDHPVLSDTPTATSPVKGILRPPSKSQITRSNSMDRYIPTKNLRTQRHLSFNADSTLEKPLSNGKESPGDSNVLGPIVCATINENPKLKPGKIPTFFTNMPISFVDVKLDEDDGIPVLPFIEACAGILPIFDKLSPTAFAPVKLDISGNIRKVRQKYSTDTDGFSTIQRIVKFEMKAKQHHLSNSATVAILWLKRSIEFLHELLHEVLMGEQDLSVAATNAYAKTLRNYHGWVVRGVFAMAAHAVPYRKEFLQHLAVIPETADTKEFQQQLMRDLKDYTISQDILIKVLNEFYTGNNLDSQEQV
ncbi:pleckstrin homology domain-containing family A member 8-like [Tubulanus polymorphus]|uniref:pleckstrin homology domain-containing family A member 8-like n=1 Tax=Tubulanus polymorphus TaxID=672921 RepID=UPI003DA20366